jgi:hypothetical protein
VPGEMPGLLASQWSCQLECAERERGGKEGVEREGVRGRPTNDKPDLHVNLP